MLTRKRRHFILEVNHWVLKTEKRHLVEAARGVSLVADCVEEEEVEELKIDNLKVSREAIKAMCNVTYARSLAI